VAIERVEGSLELGEEKLIKKEEGVVKMLDDEDDPAEIYWVVDLRDRTDREAYCARGWLAPDLCYELISRGGSVKEGEDGFIPTATAVLGKPAITAYLRIVKMKPRREIAAKLDVSRSTIDQYLSDFAKGDR